MAGSEGADRMRPPPVSVTGPVAPPEQRGPSDEYAGTDRLADEQELLEGADIIEGDDGAGFTVLERQTCFNLLATRGIGRVAFTIEGDAAPTVLPVNYTMVDGGIVFRSTLAGAIMRHARGYAAFQVDSLDEERREGWSVLASGPCAWIRDAAELARLPQGGLPRPWAEGARDQVLRITPGRLSGRRIHRR
ncbi:pyridoxamine 5'-phosphate oxidase family protein [Nocardiopsis dassonvillei]|uniref:pyridoxamine 5'-phosphate oxidase family protein n=1 Tax=Nocardiopsis dassonvillei TaxID=2014 RepID=UPI0036314CD6